MGVVIHFLQYLNNGDKPLTASIVELMRLTRGQGSTLITDGIGRLSSVRHLSAVTSDSLHGNLNMLSADATMIEAFDSSCLVLEPPKCRRSAAESLMTNLVAQGGFWPSGFRCFSVLVSSFSTSFFLGNGVSVYTSANVCHVTTIPLRHIYNRKILCIF